MENGPFIDDLPIKNMVIFHGKLLVITSGYIYIYIPLWIQVVSQELWLGEGSLAISTISDGPDVMLDVTKRRGRYRPLVVFENDVIVGRHTPAVNGWRSGKKSMLNR